MMKAVADDVLWKVHEPTPTKHIMKPYSLAIGVLAF
jgi:hypothetical protein